MKTFLCGLLIGVTLTGSAAYGIGISVDGISVRSLIVAVLMAGTVRDVRSAYQIADELLKTRHP